jgi:hypothetical protein
MTVLSMSRTEIDRVHVLKDLLRATRSLRCIKLSQRKMVSDASHYWCTPDSKAYRHRRVDPSTAPGAAGAAL